MVPKIIIVGLKCYVNKTELSSGHVCVCMCLCVGWYIIVLKMVKIE